ncbi:MAG: capsule assembly Wzi family protein [Candidatus Latescibacterota bacterium]|nr:capsule assembly Wzi family protein [Candidatus Latescibacterota bacterium]
MPALLGIAIPTAAQLDHTTNLPLDHWGYGLIERLEVRGLLSGVGDGIKPLTRGEVRSLLEGLSGDVPMTAIDSDQVRELLDQVTDAAEATGVAAPRSGAALARYNTPRGQLFADLLFRQQTDVFGGRQRDKSERILRNRGGIMMRGRVGDRLGFRFAFEQTREQGTRDYLRREHVFERRLEVPQLKEDFADYHQGSAYVVLSLPPYLDIDIGKDQASWGPAPADNLGLTGNAPGFDMVRVRSRFGALKLVHITGALRTCPDRPDSPICTGEADSSASYIVNNITRNLDREKYLAGHRLEAAVSSWLDVGFQELVVYGDRGPELSYLNPFMFYWAAQSYLGDKDNLMMALDLDVHPGNGFRWYATYAVDDLKKLKIFSDDFANKFSLQTGLLWVDPLSLGDLDLRAEYVHIEPWIYTHKFPINTFRHFDSPLGNSLGPNSDRWTLALEKRWTARASTSLSLRRSRHGDNVVQADGSILNVGGDLHRGWRPGDERGNKDFLDGRVATRTEIVGQLQWRPWPRLHLKVGGAIERGDDVPLPPNWGQFVPPHLRTGFGDGRQQHLFVDLRYGYY